MKFKENLPFVATRKVLKTIFFLREGSMKLKGKLFVGIFCLSFDKGLSKRREIENANFCPFCITHPFLKGK